MVLDAWAPLKARPDRPLLVIVPRHPARGEAVAALAVERGHTVRRDSAGESFDGTADVHVADSLGELGLWLRLAAAVLVAGSLVAGVGGHNPLEAARLGTPFASGPHVENWRDVYAALAAADGLRTVRDGEELTAAFAEMLDDPVGAAARAERARAFAEHGGRTLLSVLPKLLKLLP
jgi:3-deoxy-D-manno-octulosonic-acid transferase